MVDAANRDNLDSAASELHQLMEKPQLQVPFSDKIIEVKLFSGHSNFGLGEQKRFTQCTRY